MEHRREIDRLWEQKLAIYREHRNRELEEITRKQEEDRIYKETVEEYKKQLVAEHASLLAQFNPKAAATYGAAKFIP
jgi:hypothetical protein